MFVALTTCVSRQSPVTNHSHTYSDTRAPYNTVRRPRPGAAQRLALPQQRRPAAHTSPDLHSQHADQEESARRSRPLTPPSVRYQKFFLSPMMCPPARTVSARLICRPQRTEVFWLHPQYQVLALRFERAQTAHAEEAAAARTLERAEGWARRSSCTTRTRAVAYQTGCSRSAPLPRGR